MKNLWSRLGRIVSGPLAQYSLLMFVALRVGDVSMLLCKFFLGRHLDESRFGALDPFFSVMAVLSIPVAIMCQASIKTMSRLDVLDQKERRTAFLQDLMTLGLGGSALSCLVVLAFHRFIFSRLHLEGSGLMPVMIGLTLLVWWLPLSTAALQGTRRFRSLAAMSGLNPVLVLVFTLILVGALKMDLRGAFVARLGAGACTAVLAVAIVVPVLTGPRESYADERRAMVGSILPMSVFIVCQTLLMHFDRLFVRNFLIGQSAGYSAMLTLGQIPLWIAGPVTLILLPMASAEHARGKDLRRLTWDALIIGGVPAAASAVFLWFAAEPVMRFWNPAFAPYSPLVWKYAVAMGVECAVQFWSNIEIARHQYRGFWWMLGTTVAYCAFLYASRSWMTLGFLVWAFVGVRLVVLAGMMALDARAGRA